MGLDYTKIPDVSKDNEILDCVGEVFFDSEESKTYYQKNYKRFWEQAERSGVKSAKGVWFYTDYSAIVNWTLWADVVTKGKMKIRVEDYKLASKNETNDSHFLDETWKVMTAWDGKKGLVPPRFQVKTLKSWGDTLQEGYKWGTDTAKTAATVTAGAGVGMLLILGLLFFGKGKR